MNARDDTGTQTITVREGQMVFAIPSPLDGVEELVVVTERTAHDTGAPLDLGGAWAGLVDADALLEALDRMGREAPPSAPITAID